MVLSPAYSRDYSSKAAVLEAFNAEKDFMAYDRTVGRDRAINRQQLRGQDIEIRYAKLRKVILVRVPEEGDAVER